MTNIANLDGQAVLDALKKRVEILAKAEESQRDSFLAPILSLKSPDRDLSAMAEFAAKAHVCNMKAAAYRWVLHDLQCVLGVTTVNILEHNAP